MAGTKRHRSSGAHPCFPLKRFGWKLGTLLNKATPRALARELGYAPVVPPNPQRRDPWQYDRVLYRRRNEVEWLFRRLKGFRRVFARFDKLDVMFTALICLAPIFDALR